MSSAFAYPLRLPGWKLAVHLGLSIKTEVLVVFDKETQHFEARCYDFDRKHPIQVCGSDVLSLQKALDAEFHAALKKAFPKEPLMQPHLLVKLSLVPNLSENHLRIPPRKCRCCRVAVRQERSCGRKNEPLSENRILLFLNSLV